MVISLSTPFITSHWLSLVRGFGNFQIIGFQEWVIAIKYLNTYLPKYPYYHDVPFMSITTANVFSVCKVGLEIH